MTRPLHRPTRRGFTLTELLVVIGLLTVFGLVSARLFTASMRTLWSARKAETGIAAFENAMARMRGDVWNAREMRVADPQMLAVQIGDGGSVTWQSSAGGVLTRTELSSGQPHTITWTGITPGLTFAATATDPVVTVRVPDDKGAAEFALISQLSTASSGGTR